MPVLMFAGVAALMVVIVIYSVRASRARKEAFASLAQQMGMVYTPQADRSHDDRYPQFEVFRRGSRRAAYNTISGDCDLPTGTGFAVMGDYRYTTESGTGKDRKSTTHHFSYLIVHLPHLSTPDLDIRPENLFDKIAGVFSDTDIDFESEEFSRKFHVACADRKFAYDICHPRMMEFLLASRPPAVDVERGAVCLTGGAGLWKPEQFEQQLGWFTAFLELWPEHVVRDLEARDAMAREHLATGETR